MKISGRWLSDYVDVSLPFEELAKKLTITGTEIESVTHLGSQLSGIVVGKVLSVKKHPRADRLSVCQVDVGERALSIVCGAPNVAEEQKVPTALVGSVLPGGLKIEARTIRGVSSQGMICSEMELNISQEAAGIMVLADDAPVGKPLQEVLPLEDVILEADLTPNRPDCMSMVGIAREVAAICQTTLRRPTASLAEGPQSVHQLVSVELQDPEACPRYTARLIQGVKIGPSPLWLSQRLAAADIRSINNVVDITNYVMMELGQPLHAFDFDLLAGDQIRVRRAQEGENFVTLDERKHSLDPEVLLICDAEKPVALAGIMGGLQSEVTQRTANILLESAYFHPATIRRGSKRLNISTESSQRFERGVDPNGVIDALDRAAQLIADLSGGQVAKGAVDCYPKPIEAKKIPLRIGKTNQLLGTDLTGDQMASFLESLGFKTRGEGPMDVLVPTFRPDVGREIDLVEEIARLYGYDRIEACVRGGGNLKISPAWEDEALGKIKSALSGLGFYEVVTNSLTDPNLFSLIGPKESPRRIINPLSEDLSALRPNLIPSLLQVVQRNFHRSTKDMRIFELGKIFRQPDPKDFSAEKWSLCGVIAGRRWPASWDRQDVQVDFYDLKGLLESLLDKLSIDNFNFLPYDGGVFQQGMAATLMLGETRCGYLGQLAPEVRTAFDLVAEVFLFHVEVASLIESMTRDRRYASLPKFPTAERDLAIVVPEEVLAGQLEGAIRKAGGELVVEVRLFDVYRGKQIAAGKKGLAYSIRYQSPVRTLTDREVDDIQKRIVATIREKFGAELRA
jgi:phenylalanyl-tRNA synthetase beta chain